MSNQPPNPPSFHEDEIDLRKLFQSIGRVFINIGHGIIRIILAIRRVTLQYKYLLLAGIIIGGIAGASFNRYTKPYYKTSLLLKSNYLNDKLVANSIEKLNLLCSETERLGLSKALNLSSDVAKNIIGFDHEPFVDEADIIEIELLKQRLQGLKIDQSDINKIVEQIAIENSGTFLISVLIYETGIIDNLQDALVGYFQNNPFVANRIKFNNLKQENLITKLTADIRMLDSLKSAYNLNLQLQARKDRDASNSVFLGESGAVNPVSIYTQGNYLYRQLQATKLAHALGSHFELIDGFASFNTPESPNIKKATMSAIGLFLALAYGLIILIEINKYLNRIEKEGFKGEV